MDWDAERYTRDFAFVHQYGEDVLDWLEFPPGARVIDLGCGNGALTAELARRGASVWGMDASEEMLKEARRLHPSLPFQRGDVRFWEAEEPVDAVFSNAVFHWVPVENHPLMLWHINRSLNMRGQLVCEFGGKGNGATLHGALRRAFEKRGYRYALPFYFPSIGDYAPMLEQAGFRVERALLLERPTCCRNGEAGLREWIRMFVQQPFRQMEHRMARAVVEEVEEELRPHLFHDGNWYVDYVRIRWKAVKEREASGCQPR